MNREGWMYFCFDSLAPVVSYDDTRYRCSSLHSAQIVVFLKGTGETTITTRCVISCGVDVGKLACTVIAWAQGPNATQKTDALMVRRRRGNPII